MMTYEEALSYIEGIEKFTEKHDLAVVRTYLSILEHPERAFDLIHIAGTNGKGSVAAFMEAALRGGGHRTGLFTSPHLVSIEERFRINGVLIEAKDFLYAFDIVRDAIREHSELPHPTWFEFLFLLGMVVFRRAGCRVVLLETGLGGRLDATNAIEAPILCVITSIGMDHMMYLGDTIQKIAREKAGILKDGVPTVIGRMPKEAENVIIDCANERGITVYMTDHADVSYQYHRERGGIDFLYGGDYDEGSYFIPFEAPYQVANAMLALRALSVIRDRYPLSQAVIREALSHVRWDGRMQKIAPDIYIDGAHNEEGVRGFCEAARIIAEGRPVHLLCGVMRDKDVSPMVEQLCKELSPRYVITTLPDEGRGLAPEALGALFRTYLADGVVLEEEQAERAFERAVREKEEAVLFVVGSLYLIGRVLAYHDQL